METSEIFLNGAYALLLASTFTRSLRRLRFALIAASICFIFFGVLVENWTMVAWNTLIGSLHTYRWYQFTAARRSIRLDDEASAVRSRLFPSLDAFDFNALWAMGETISMESTDPLTVANTPNHHIYLILEGEVTVERDDSPLMSMGPDHLVGEFSFANDEPAKATVTPNPTVRVRTWDHSRLAALDEVSPGAAKTFNQFITTELVKKLNASK